MKIPEWYLETTRIAKDYYDYLKRRDMATVKALQDALEELRDDEERHLIRMNLFQRVPMRWVNVSMSIITMKRIRKRYLRIVARKLGKG